MIGAPRTLTFGFELSKDNSESDWEIFHRAAQIIMQSGNIVKFVERPGQSYLCFHDSIPDREIQNIFSILCKAYNLQEEDSFRKASKEYHYEIKGKLVELFENDFPYPKNELIINATSKHQFMAHTIHTETLLKGEVTANAARPGKIYLNFIDVKKTNDQSIQRAFNGVCSLYNLNPEEHFRKASTAHHYEISSHLHNLYVKGFPREGLVIKRHLRG